MKKAIYIPGLGYDMNDVSMASYVKQYTAALDKNDGNKLYHYSVDFERKIFDESKNTGYDVGIISRTVPGNNVSLTPGGVEITNISYELADNKNIGMLDYMLLLSFHMNRMYWDGKTNGMSYFTNYNQCPKKICCLKES